MFLVAELFGKLEEAPSRRTGRSDRAGKRDQLARQIAFDVLSFDLRPFAAIEREALTVQAAGGQGSKSQRIAGTLRGAQRRPGESRSQVLYLLAGYRGSKRSNSSRVATT
jgi:hypothetical protein